MQASEVFGGRLYEAIRATGMSQRGFAAKLRLTEGAVSKWIKGRTEPSLDDLARCARLARVSLDWLLGLTDDTPTAVLEPQLNALEVARVQKKVESLRGEAEAIEARLRAVLGRR